MKSYNWKKGIIVLIICGLIGEVGGVGLTYLMESNESVDWTTRLGQVTPVLYIIALTFGIIGLGGYIYFNIKLKKEGYSNEENSFYENHEKVMSVVMTFSTLCAIINFIAMGLNIQKSTPLHVLLLVNVAIAFLGEVLYISLVKKVRPELNADPLEVNFRKHYFDKLDEYEKNKTGKACFQTISAMTMFYPILFLVCYAVTLIFNVSAIICLPIGGIWILQTIFMTYYSNKEVKAKR